MALWWKIEPNHSCPAQRLLKRSALTGSPSPLRPAPPHRAGLPAPSQWCRSCCTRIIHCQLRYGICWFITAATLLDSKYSGGSVAPSHSRPSLPLLEHFSLISFGFVSPWWKACRRLSLSSNNVLMCICTCLFFSPLNYIWCMTPL